MAIKLPDLEIFRKEILRKGTVYPLTVIPKPEAGLLQELPPPPPGKTGWGWTEQTDPGVYKDQSNWAKLTIVTPSYNQAAFIEETIRSVLLQNYPNLEYIVMDGGSTDGSTEIIKKYAPWISYWQSEKDSGQSNAINMGFSLASGDYYAWINSDDYYLKGVFNKVIRQFNRSGARFVYGYVLNFVTVEKEFKLIETYPLIDYLIRLPTLAQPSCFWSATIHLPLWEELHCSLDYELWLRMVKGKKRKLIKEPLSVANIHADAKTSNADMGEVWTHDHDLICSKDAHGPVENWNTLVKVKRLIGPIVKWLA